MTLALFLVSVCAFGDVSVTERSSILRLINTDASASVYPPSPLTPAERAAIAAANQAKRDAKHKKQHMAPDDLVIPPSPLTPAQRDAIRAANQAKRDAKHKKQHPTSFAAGAHPRTNATGSIQLIDSSGLKFFINTNITFSTSSSASGAASEASYTHAIAASTMAGGLVMSTLNDMYDGYQSMCVSLTNALAQCVTGNANFTIYNKRGPAAFDATVPAGPTCTNRQVVYPAQTIGPLSVRRKVFVPTNDTFIRWLNIYTNTSGAPVTFTTMTCNNLGSDSNTIIVNSSSGGAINLTDTWVTTFQNYSGVTSTDPRIGHVMQGVGAPTPLAVIQFMNGSDRPFWGYSITLAPGQTKIIMNFATGQGTKALANSKSATLATAPASALQCMSNAELGQVTNFALQADLSIVKTALAPNPFGGFPINYTLAVSNAGPSPASSLSVTDVLPAGTTFVSASGPGWTCNNVAGTVTCTLPTLNSGANSSIALTVTAPAAGGMISNTATVSSATTDPNPANNTSTVVVNIAPASAIPTLSGWMLIMMAAALATVGFLLLGRRG
jgi:uncharacterized repeat protein (TIGR01451 family)